MSLEKTGTPFRTTCWSAVERAREGDEAGRRAALGELIEAYWPPVYAYLRAKGRGRDEAAELTQAFFAEVVLRRGLFEQADPGKGRLRSLLLSSLQRFAVDQHRRGAARGNGKCVPVERLEREEALLEKGRAAEDVFERRWALALFEEAMRRCEAHFVQAGRGSHWALFEERVVRPALAMTTAAPLADAGPRLGFRTAADAAAAVQVVKKRAMALLREVAAETAEGAEAQEEEYRMVMGVLG